MLSINNKKKFQHTVAIFNSISTMDFCKTKTKSHTTLEYHEMSDKFTKMVMWTNLSSTWSPLSCSNYNKFSKCFICLTSSSDLSLPIKSPVYIWRTLQKIYLFHQRYDRTRMWISFLIKVVDFLVHFHHLNRTSSKLDGVECAFS